MRWTQTKWNKGKCWAWIGTRADGRSFRIYFFPHLGYVVSTFNGKRLATCETLAAAQACADEHMKPAQIEVVA